MQFFAGLLLLAFIAGSMRLLGYCLTNGRVRLRFFLLAWFLVLSVLLLRGAWVSFTVDRRSDTFGEAIGRMELGFLSLGGAMVFGALALAYFAPTIWPSLQRRRLPSSPDESRAAAYSTPTHWPEALLITLIVFPLFGVTWLTLTLFFPAAIALPRSDRPVAWLKATTSPTSADAAGRVLTWGETTFYTQSSSGHWNRVSFLDGSHSFHLAVLSPNTVLITRPAPMPLNTLVGRGYNPLVGAVYVKGSEGPAATVPASEDISPVPSGGFGATRCAPSPRCEDHSCRSCSNLTVERFDSLGVLITSTTLPIPRDATDCNWWPVHRLIGEDVVYVVNSCPVGSCGTGYYRASPNGVQRITSRILSNEYTFVEDQNEMEAQTAPVNWYRIPWMHDPI